VKGRHDRRYIPERAEVLVVMAHPDDAEFGCGGTIASLAAQGKCVWYVLITSGDKGTEDRDMPPHELAARREIEQRNAARALGAAGCTFLAYPDGFVEDTPELRGKLVGVIRRLKPDIVITWDGYRHSFNHRDHRLTGIVALDACFPGARDHLYFPEHLTEEGLDTHKVGEAWLMGADQPDHFVDVGDFFKQRGRAVACHVSQIGKRPPTSFEKRWRARAREVGKAAGMKYAEGFRRVAFRR
jgi:LmbE family N-acetylglucosaminyl deacetylase